MIPPPSLRGHFGTSPERGTSGRGGLVAPSRPPDSPGAFIPSGEGVRPSVIPPVKGCHPEAWA